MTVSLVEPYSKNEDVAGTLASLVISRLRGQERWQAWLAAAGKPMQDAEDTLWSLLTETRLDNATGVNLDRYGALIGEGRGDLEDDNYRIVLQGLFMAYASQGDIDTIIRVTAKVADAFLSTVLYVQHQPASYSVQFEQAYPVVPGSDFAARIRRALEAATVAGVGVGSIVPYTTPAFGFGEADGSHASYIGGLGVGKLSVEI